MSIQFTLLKLPPTARGYFSYSARNASVGFTEAAQYAGKKLAASEAPASTTATHAKVGTSQACTPNSTFRISIEVPTEQTNPMPTPVAASHPA